jgi:hypothetical protein
VDDDDEGIMMWIILIRLREGRTCMMEIKN